MLAILHYLTNELTPCCYPYIPYNQDLIIREVQLYIKIFGSKNFGEYYFNRQSFSTNFFNRGVLSHFFTAKVFYYTVDCHTVSLLMVICDAQNMLYHRTLTWSRV